MTFYFFVFLFIFDFQSKNNSTRIIKNFPNKSNFPRLLSSGEDFNGRGNTKMCMFLWIFSKKLNNLVNTPYVISQLRVCLKSSGQKLWCIICLLLSSLNLCLVYIKIFLFSVCLIETAFHILLVFLGHFSSWFFS